MSNGKKYNPLPFAINNNENVMNKRSGSRKKKEKSKLRCTIGPISSILCIVNIEFNSIPFNGIDIN